MDVVYQITAIFAFVGMLAAFPEGKGGYVALAIVIIWLSLMNFADERKVSECQKTLPRNESCELIAVPSSTLVESE